MIRDSPDLHAGRPCIEAGDDLARAELEGEGRPAVADRVVEDLAVLREIAGIEDVGGLPGLDLRARSRRDGGDLHAVDRRRGCERFHREGRVGGALREGAGRGRTRR